MLPDTPEPVFTTDYLSTGLRTDRRREAIDKTVAFLSSYTHQFDCIAFRGMSGALVAPSVADALDKHIILVRKPNELHHGYAEVEGTHSLSRYIIVDDFVWSGETVREIYQAVNRKSFAANPVPLFICVYAREQSEIDRNIWLTQQIECKVHGTDDVVSRARNKLSRIGNLLGI